jgi:hypothetical protein
MDHRMSLVLYCKYTVSRTLRRAVYRRCTSTALYECRLPCVRLRAVRRRPARAGVGGVASTDTRNALPRARGRAAAPRDATPAIPAEPRARNEGLRCLPRPRRPRASCSARRRRGGAGGRAARARGARRFRRSAAPRCAVWGVWLRDRLVSSFVILQSKHVRNTTNLLGRSITRVR